MNLAEINALSLHEFVGTLGAVYEHQDWIARRAYDRGPFASFDALAEALQDAVVYAPQAEQTAALRAQQPAGATAAAPGEQQQLQRLLGDYQAKFGFPFIVANQPSPSTLIALCSDRLQSDAETEISEAIRQAGRRARQRLALLVTDE
jgi:2-oxo-4-hydroxy-4-carboxy--5-ureidoimidazoline (OHCU) decarboxylase